MSTSHSPLKKLKTEAARIAKQLKMLAAGKSTANDPAGKIKAALARETVNFGIVMDDKVLTVEMPWSQIRETSEAGIAEWILDYMRDARAQSH